MKLKKTYLSSIVLILLIAIVSISCSKGSSITYGNWVSKSSFNGTPRGNAVTFTIGDMGYLATGYDGDNYLNDLWVYNRTGNYWEQKANFPGVARTSAVSFELNGKGYIGTGYDGTNKLNDFYSYNPTSNTWSKKADFAGTARYGAIGFSVSGKGFIGTGYDGSELKDFYEYNDVTDTWTQSLGYGGGKRKNAVVFVIDNKAYVGTGLRNGAYENDFYVFDGDTQVWTKLTNLDSSSSSYNVALSSGTAFTLNGLGYIATGLSSGVSTTLYVYDPTTDTWSEDPNFEGSARQDAVSFNFTSSNTAFVLTGRSGTYYFDDIWEYKPYEELNTSD